VKKYITEYLKAAHKDSIFNYKEILESEGLDSVIGSESGFPIDDPDFLEEMQRH